MERLQKVIANSGYTSRRKAENLISSGKVKVNGVISKELGVKVKPTDVIEINGVKLYKEEKEYYLLYKPRGVISSTDDDKGRKTVIDLVDTSSRVYPIGRLDYDTTGVLLLTNDGDFANMLMHPSNEVEKVYFAKVKGILKGEHIKSLEQGVVIDGVKTSRAKVKLKRVDKKQKTSFVELTIHEGRNHQVKKMFESVGFEVIKLSRERLAFFTLEGLTAGDYRPLKPKEVKKAFSSLKKDK